MRTITKTTELNYFNFLKDLHYLLSYTDNISMIKLIRKHNLNNNVTTVLLNNKIISNNGLKSKACRWNWDSDVVPNTKMAERLRGELTKYNAKMNEQSVKKRKEKEIEFANKTHAEKVVELVTTPENRREKHNPKAEVSIFWGMFKIKFC